MLRCNDYIFAESLEQAYVLNQKRNNVIVAGNGWIKMGKKQWSSAIDLSRLGLDKIEEDDEKFSIGCMVTLREIEKHKGLNSFTDNAVKESVRHIVGTQFRNNVTVGGSIYGRFGFSDVLTVFLVMDSYVEMYKGGLIPLREFAKMDYDNDILVRLIIKKTPLKMSYKSFRNQSTDFPVITCAIAFIDDKIITSVGARPSRACITEYSGKIEDIEKFAAETAAKFNYGSNMRAGADYRAHIAKILIKRAVADIKAMG